MGIPFVGVPRVGVPKVVGGVLLFALSSFRFNASREFRSRIAGLTEIYFQSNDSILATVMLVKL